MQVTSSGEVVSVDGGNAVTQTIVNTTGQEQKFAFVEAGKVTGVLDLQNGQSGEFTYNNAPSARIEEATSSGTVLPQEALLELNTGDEEGHPGLKVTAEDVSKIDSPNGANGTPVNITVTDNKGLSVGDGTAAGDYFHPNDDQKTTGNPMVMAMDTSVNYTTDFSAPGSTPTVPTGTTTTAANLAPTAPASTGTPTSTTPTEPTTSTSPPSSTSASTQPGTPPTDPTTPAHITSSGQVVSIDGGNTVKETIVNTTGQEQKFAFVESGKVVGLLDLQNGQSGQFQFNSAPSARIEEATSSGTVLPQEALLELNSGKEQGNPGVQVTAEDVSKIDSSNGANGTPVNITVADDKGLTVGDGTAAGDYFKPNDDQQAAPHNPGFLTQDTSLNYTADFSAPGSTPTVLTGSTTAVASPSPASTATPTSTTTPSEPATTATSSPSTSVGSPPATASSDPSSPGAAATSPASSASDPSSSTPHHVVSSGGASTPSSDPSSPLASGGHVFSPAPGGTTLGFGSASGGAAQLAHSIGLELLTQFASSAFPGGLGALESQFAKIAETHQASLAAPHHG